MRLGFTPFSLCVPVFGSLVVADPLPERFRETPQKVLPDRLGYPHLLHLAFQNDPVGGDKYLSFPSAIRPMMMHDDPLDAVGG